MSSANRLTKEWNLLADIGGTHARFAIECLERKIIHDALIYSVSQYGSLDDVIDTFLYDVEILGLWHPYPTRACFAVAGVVDNPVIRFTNSAWQFTKSQISEKLGGISIEIINDFEGVARAIPHLSTADWYELDISKGKSSGQNFAILGPGTGLGVAGLISCKGDYRVISGEGGHADFAPINDKEFRVFKYLENRFGRASLERLLSGEGIVNIYSALAEEIKTSVRTLDEVAIGKAADSGEDEFCLEVMNLFFSILGSTAGNLALTFGARGGVYIAGGIVPRYITLLEKSTFRSRFEDKGRYQAYLKEIPIRIITRSDAGLIGAADKLDLPIR